MRMKKWRLPVVAFSFLTPFFFPEPPLYPRIGKALRWMQVAAVITQV